MNFTVVNSTEILNDLFTNCTKLLADSPSQVYCEIVKNAVDDYVPILAQQALCWTGMHCYAVVDNWFWTLNACGYYGNLAYGPTGALVAQGAWMFISGLTAKAVWDRVVGSRNAQTTKTTTFIPVSAEHLTQYLQQNKMTPRSK